MVLRLPNADLIRSARPFRDLPKPRQPSPGFNHPSYLIFSEMMALGDEYDGLTQRIGQLRGAGFRPEREPNPALPAAACVGGCATERTRAKAAMGALQAPWISRNRARLPRLTALGGTACRTLSVARSAGTLSLRPQSQGADPQPTRAGAPAVRYPRRRNPGEWSTPIVTALVGSSNLF
jgi:hypothetical protein